MPMRFHLLVDLGVKGLELRVLAGNALVHLLVKLLLASSQGMDLVLQCDQTGLLLTSAVNFHARWWKLSQNGFLDAMFKVL